MVKPSERERQFYFGAMVYGDYLDLALQMPDLEDRLNAQIDLREYADRLKKIYFVPILVHNDNEDTHERRYFDKEEKEVLLIVNITPEQLKEPFPPLVGRLLCEELAQLGLAENPLFDEIHKALAGSVDE